jgi:hypothetical protein
VSLVSISRAVEQSQVSFGMRSMRILTVFGASLLLIVTASFAADNQKTLTARKLLMTQLRRCLEEIPAVVDSPVTSPCGGRKVDILSGMQIDVLVNELGDPTWCRSASGLNYLHGSECKPSKQRQWAWSFYRLPENTVGGGPELICDLDSAGHCATVKWILTQ